MLGKFIDAFKKAFTTLPANALWSGDPVPRTSTMQAYIYARIADTLGLCLVCEYNDTDAAYFSKEAIQKAIQAAAPKNCDYPNAQQPTLCLEHENDITRSYVEMNQLVKTGASLNVLVTYLHEVTPEQQIIYINERYAPILKALGQHQRDFVVVLPSKKYEQHLYWLAAERQWADLGEIWRFFVWNQKKETFEQRF
jgi:hypothetical protein